MMSEKDIDRRTLVNGPDRRKRGSSHAERGACANAGAPIPPALRRRNSKLRRMPAIVIMHIYDEARFAMAPSPRVPPTNAAVPQYRLLQKRIGTTRVVIVTPAQLRHRQPRHGRCDRATRNARGVRRAPSDGDGCGAETIA